ncbi:MAG TPA: acetolactate decarboxylase [Phycisphaerae bacterium]|nr:acetolactate decarboxylase [Phycisphaerae bacterium]
MNKTQIGKAMRLGMWLLWAAALAGCAPAGEALYQYSTIPALMEGVYDGELTLGELRRRGDLGLGTFNALDGEMIVLDGAVYQATADGKVRRAPDGGKTPFAAVVPFRPAAGGWRYDPERDGASLEKYLDTLAPSANLAYAVRIDGTFRNVMVRSVPAQRRPYPRLAQAAAGQKVFELTGVRGTIVGFRLPEYLAGVNVPGWHLHFLSADRAAGGHLLRCRAEQADVRVMEIRRVELQLPDTPEFRAIQLTGPKHQELRKIEK